MTAFYDPLRTYEANYAEGPFGAFADASVVEPAGEPRHEFLGHALHTPFGIPAGPLLNARFCEAAFRHGYALNVYKTVRSRARDAHPFPNALAVHHDGPLTLDDAARPVLADADFAGVHSVSNSFGVPSRDPDEWQPDMARAVAAAGEGQLLIGSFQGTHAPDGTPDRDAAYVRDQAVTARLVADTGARVVEVNLSCPNEGTSNLLCFDIPRVVRIASAIKDEVGDLPLILKLAYFPDDAALGALVKATSGIVQGYAAVNTIPARLVSADGRQALPGPGREVAGVCGAAIAWAGLEMVERLARLRDDASDGFVIVGVGGVRSVEGYRAMRHAGADAVMSAVGAMFSPSLGAQILAASEGGGPGEW